MLTYKEAIKKILGEPFRLKTETVPLRKGLDRVVSKDLVSPEPFPSFNNSAVDGYAVSSVPVNKKRLGFEVSHEIKAGEYFNGILKPGHSVRIFTGAYVPKGTQAVVMQEEVERVNDYLILSRKPSPKENIRFFGEDFKKGEALISSQTRLNPTHLAVLAAVGYQKIPVYQSPKVGILATGSELLKTNRKLKPGKIRDSNTVLLEGLVEQTGGMACSFPCVGDEPKKIRKWIRKGLIYDVLLISGGISVGRYDFVKEILKEEGVKEIFWKVAIKPGKPIFFGRKNQTFVFGLPGNPVSVFVTFQEFVKPLILKMSGRKEPEHEVEGRLTQSFQNGSRLHFVRVRWERMGKFFKVTPLKGQGSHRIGTLAASNGILKVEPNRLLRKNERISVKII